MYLKLNILKKRGNKLFFRSTLVVINEQNLHEKNKTKQKPLKSSKMGLNQRLKLGTLKFKMITEEMSPSFTQAMLWTEAF